MTKPSLLPAGIDKITRAFIPLVTFMILIAFASALSAETRIASWNIKRLRDDNKDFAAVVEVLSYFDVVGIQEAMEEDGVTRLVDELEDYTGTDWGVMASHAIGRGSYKEHYVYVWRKNRVEFVDSALVYLDAQDVFAREPLSARFRELETGTTFMLANIHVLYGDSKSDRTPEIRALSDYWEWLGDTFPNEQFFLMGDFNMEPDDDSFLPLTRYARPVITNGATTLSTNEGQYANLYDNIWIPRRLSAEVSSGIFRFPQEMEYTNEYARGEISDHAPVYMILSDMNEESGLYAPATASPDAAPVQ
ncbi:endonuclease/exonuclease/phosphatase family protein [Salipiger mucosus]|nr:endonuclease/exonuclease/phosphatase family protein [Salipiger mucosus]